MPPALNAGLEWSFAWPGLSGNMTAQVVYWIGPIFGALIAAMLWHHVLLRDESAVAEDVA